MHSVSTWPLPLAHVAVCPNPVRRLSAAQFPRVSDYTLVGRGATAQSA